MLSDALQALQVRDSEESREEQGGVYQHGLMAGRVDVGSEGEKLLGVGARAKLMRSMIFACIMSSSRGLQDPF